MAIKSIDLNNLIHILTSFIKSKFTDLKGNSSRENIIKIANITFF